MQIYISYKRFFDKKPETFISGKRKKGYSTSMNEFMFSLMKNIPTSIPG